MDDQITIDGDEERNLVSAILEWVEAKGVAMTIRETANELLESGFFSDKEIGLEALRYKWARSKVKQAFDQKAVNGFPHLTAVTAGRDPIYKRYEQLVFNDYTFIIESRIKSAFQDYEKLVSWHEDCRKRFGHAPSIPDLEF
jgi:hypothetical protein